MYAHTHHPQIFHTLRRVPEDRVPKQRTHLCDVEEQEGHHEGEETSGLSEGETQNGVLEELTPEGRVAGDTLDEGTENRSDTDTSTSKTDGGNTGTLDLGGSDHGGGGRLSDDATLLDDLAAGVVLEGVADGVVHDEAVLGGGSCRDRVNGCLMALNASSSSCNQCINDDDASWSTYPGSR